MAMQVVVMGPAGSGKSSLGVPLAERLGVPFLEGDSLHPSANREKMAAGVPLTDEDRRPWLEAIVTRLAGARRSGLVVACSALKHSYRELIREQSPQAFFVFLRVPHQVLAARLDKRKDHFFPPALLSSQVADLEPLTPDENGVVVDGTQSIDAAIEQVLGVLPNSV
jgi:carbohydrate kinase (thermoresistant glucokinase family)